MKDRSLPFVFMGFLLAVLLLAACSFEIPEKVHVTGNPKYVANLGSNSVKAFYLKEHFGAGDINEIFNKDGDAVFQTYEYKPSGAAVMTYLLHYKPDLIELPLDTDGFNFQPGDGGNEITIASVDVPSMNFSPVPISAVLGIAPGGNSNITPLLIELDDYFIGTTDFTKATIERGTITLKINNEEPDVFSEVVITVESNSTQVLSRVPEGAHGQFSLAGINITPETTISFSGSIVNNTDTLIPAGPLTAQVDITELESITVVPSALGQTPAPQLFTMGLDEVKTWLKSITFEEIGMKIKSDTAKKMDGQIKLTIEEDGGTALLALDETEGHIDFDDIYKADGAKFTVSGTLGDLDQDSPSGISIKVTPEFESGAEVTIYDIVPGTLVEIKLAPEMVIEWEEAQVYPDKMVEKMGGDTEYLFPEQGEDTIDLSELFESLEDAMGKDAGKIKLKEAELYLYIESSESSGNLLQDSEFGLTAIYADTPSSEHLLTDPDGNGYAEMLDPNVEPPVFVEGQPYTTELPEQYAAIPMAGILNAKPPDFRLKAEVNLPSTAVTIERGEDYSVRFAPQIVIKLPLSLEIERKETADSGETLDEQGFAALDLNLLVYDEGDGGTIEKEDLFKREDPDDKKEAFEFLENINFRINYDNGLTNDGARLELKLILANKQSEPLTFSLNSGQGHADFSLSRDDITYPFEPDIQLWIPTGGDGDGEANKTSLALKSGDPYFKINSMSITADMVIDKTETF